jgi:hypothetical protein
MFVTHMRLSFMCVCHVAQHQSKQMDDKRNIFASTNHFQDMITAQITLKTFIMTFNTFSRRHKRQNFRQHCKRRGNMALDAIGLVSNFEM